MEIFKKNKLLSLSIQSNRHFRIGQTDWRYNVRHWRNCSFLNLTICFI